MPAALNAKFEPAQLELKGFCNFEERKANGVTRAEATTIVQNLKQLLPEEAANAVGEIKHRGGRN